MNRKTLVPMALSMVGWLVSAPLLGAVKTVAVQVRVDSEAPGYEGFRAMDGNPESMWHTDFDFQQTPPPHEIVVDLGAPYELSGFAYLPRRGGGNGTIGRYECCVSNSAKDFGKPVVAGTFAKPRAEQVVPFPAKQKGRYVRLRALSEVNGGPWTSIAELRLLCQGVQFLRHRLGRRHVVPAGRETAGRAGSAVLRLATRSAQPGLFRPRGCRDPPARGPHRAVRSRPGRRGLAADCGPAGRSEENARGADLSPLEKQLVALRGKNAKVSPSDAEARLALFKQICGVRREIAFANPLLNFDKILFIKRHRSVYNHMCDQYYGITMRPGGGLYVLAGPFGPKPEVRDVLAGSVVRRGRLTGQKLSGGSGPSPALSYDGVGNIRGVDGPSSRGDNGRQPQGIPPSAAKMGLSPSPARGSFLSPNLSYDAKTILFAYVECRGDTGHQSPHRSEQGPLGRGRCYHVFKVNVDGSGLEQLTDGTWNDFDPCWLPNGRIAFITERRGGYLRCGRVCPIYTLYDMAADGTRHHGPELPRDQRVAPQRDARRPDHLYPLGLRGPLRLHGASAVDHHARRPRLAGGARQFRPAQRAARHGAGLPRRSPARRSSWPRRPRTTGRPSARWCSSIRAWRTTTPWRRSSGSRPTWASPRARADARPTAPPGR